MRYRGRIGTLRNTAHLAERLITRRAQTSTQLSALIRARLWRYRCVPAFDLDTSGRTRLPWSDGTASAGVRCASL